MNKKRRVRIGELIKQLDDLIIEAESIREEEEEYFENMPESLQGGDKGSAAEVAIQALEAAESSIAEAISELETSIE